MPMQFPDGLPVGPEWVSTSASDEVRFPYDDSLIATAPVGDAALATKAIDHAIGVRQAMAALPSHARRTILIDAHDALAAHQEEFE